MIIHAHKEIVHISENEDINMKNYLESLDYISNLYSFTNNLKKVISMKECVFLPTFVGRYVSQELNIDTDDKESEMKIFKITSKLFLEENVVKDIIEKMTPVCESIIVDGTTITFILK